MRKLTSASIVFIAVLMFLMTFSPMVSSAEDPIQIDENVINSESVFAPEDHSDFDGSTSWHYDMTSTDSIETSTYMELVNGELKPIFNSSRPSPVLKTIASNMDNVQGYSGGRDYTAVYGDTIFWAYNWKNGSNIQASLIASYDQGTTWTTPVDIHLGSTYGMRVGVYIWKDTLFYFINDIPSNILNRRLYVKQAPISTWTNLRTATLTTILNNRALDYDICSDSNNIYVATVRTSELEGWFYYYDGSSWSSGTKVVDRGYCTRSSIEVQQVGSDTRILYFYARHWESGAFADGDLHMKYTTDLGSSWSSEIQVMDDDNSYYQPTTENINGTLVAICNHIDRDEITLVRSFDGGNTWSDELDIVSLRGANSLHLNTYGFHTNYLSNKNRLQVTYETSADTINVTYSDDYGANWVNEYNSIQVDTTKSYDPRLPRDANMITYMFDQNTNQDLKLKWLHSYEPTSTAIMTECSPPMLGSWNSIGFDVSIPARTFVHYRVLDGEDNSILQGWTNLSAKTSGIINGINFNKTDTFAGTWAGSSLASSIKVEVRLTSFGMMHPSLWQVHLDYSTSPPYDEDLMDLLGIEEYDCSWEPGWMNFSGKGRSEYITTEPIELENSDSWPDALMMDVYNLDSSNNIIVGLIDPATDFYITGFTTKDFDVITQDSSESTTILTWKGQHLGDLPGTVRAFKIEIQITSNPNNQPPSGIHRIWMADNLPPEIIGIDADPYWYLQRTEWVEISVWVDDDLEMTHELNCLLYYRTPGSLVWEQTLLDPMGIEGPQYVWNLSVPAEAPVGEWEVMANVTDSFGEFSGDTIASSSLWISNNRPTPPEIAITPEIPLTLDDITVTLVTPGADVELYEEELTYKYEWFKNSELNGIAENATDYSSIITADETEKGNEWMVKVYTWDGIEFSDPVSASVTVGNTEPFVNGTYGPYHFDEDIGTVEIDMNSMFTDNDEDGLEFMVFIDVPYAFDILPGDILMIQIPDDWFGQILVNVSVNDGDLSNQTSFEVIIDPVNDLPILNESTILTINEDEWFNTSFTGYDPADMDELTFSIEAYEDIPGLVEGENFFFYPNGSFHILPTNSMVGEHIFNLSVDDGKGGIVWMNVKVVVVNVNDAPTGTINGPLGPVTIENGKSVTLNATGSDIDGDDVEISWILNHGSIVEVTLGYGSELNVSFSEDGTYNVTCFISDGTEFVFLGNISIIVFTPVPDNTPPYGLIPSITPDTIMLDPFDSLDVTSSWISSRQVPTDVPIKLFATASDDEGDLLTFTWSIVEDPSWQMTGSDIIVPANNLTVGTYTFKVTVDDGNNHSIEVSLDPISVVEPYSGLEDAAEALAWMLLCSIITPVVIVLLIIAILIFVIIRRKRKGDDAVKEMPKSDIVEVPPPIEVGQTGPMGGMNIQQQQIPFPPGVPAPQQQDPLPPPMQQQWLPQPQPVQQSTEQYPQQIQPQQPYTPPIQQPLQQYPQQMQSQGPPVQQPPPMQQAPPYSEITQQQTMPSSPPPIQQYPDPMRQQIQQAPMPPAQRPTPQQPSSPVQQLPQPTDETI